MSSMVNRVRKRLPHHHQVLLETGQGRRHQLIDRIQGARVEALRDLFNQLRVLTGWHLLPPGSSATLTSSGGGLFRLSSGRP
jgi:hypothetical protein